MKFTNHKKVILIIICISILALLFSLGYNSSNEVANVNIQDYVVYNQLPSGLFLEGEITNNNDNVDLYSTILMNKIKNIINYDNKELYIDNVVINDISFLQALIDSNLFLGKIELEKCKKFIENADYYQKIKKEASKDEYIINLLFAIQTLQFADQFGINISYKDDIKEIISSELSDLDSVDNVKFYTVLQGVKLFDITVDNNLIRDEVNKRFDKCINSEFSHYSDIISLYYISKLSVDFNIKKRDISDDLANMLMGIMSCTYDNISILYDLTYVLDCYDKMDENRSAALRDIIDHITEIFYINEGLYGEIVMKTPSLEGTFAAIKLAEANNIVLPKLDNIKDYLNKTINSDNIYYLNNKDALYVFQITQILNLDYSGRYKMVLKYYFQENLFNKSIEDLYYTFYLVDILGQNKEYGEKIENEVKRILDGSMNFKRINDKELSMLLIIANSYGVDVNYDKKLIIERLGECSSIIELDYLVKCYKQLYSDNNFKKIVRKKINNLKNEKGYYISPEIKINTFYSLLLGKELERLI